MIPSSQSAPTVPQTNSSPNPERTNLSIHMIAPSAAELTPHAIYSVDHRANPGLPAIPQWLQYDHSGTPTLFPASVVTLSIPLAHATRYFKPTATKTTSTSIVDPNQRSPLYVGIRPPSFNIRLPRLVTNNSCISTSGAPPHTPGPIT